MQWPTAITMEGKENAAWNLCRAHDGEPRRLSTDDGREAGVRMDRRDPALWMEDFRITRPVEGAKVGHIQCVEADGFCFACRD